jgi:nucleoside phosphorylase
MRKSPTVTTIKRLFANSGGVCAFPNCPVRLIDDETKVNLGEMCHISAASPNGPRYDESLTDEERNSDENLIIFCATHHSLIDKSPESYTIEKLKEIKFKHEAKVSTFMKNNFEIGDKEATTLAKQIDEESIDFAIVTALPKELEAVLHYFPELTEDKEKNTDNRLYFKGIIKTNNGDNYRIVATLLNTMGNLEAANATSDLINKWNPRYILVSGIAGGLDSSRQDFGDVVVSDSIIYYESGKVKVSGIEPRSRQFISDRNLIMGMHKLMLSNPQLNLPKNYKDIKPKIEIGIIASGEKVISSSDEVRRLFQIHSKLIAVEMESAGVASAAFSAVKQIGFLTFRGICDFADEKKSDDWQDLASYSAAAILRKFIVSKPVSISEGKWPTSNTLKIEPSKELTVIKRQEIFNKLRESFDLEDFNNFCFLIGVDIDELAGQKKSSKIVELILYFERRNKVDLLETSIKKLIE